MQVKRVIFLVLILMLAISMLTGCPPQVPPPGDSLTAKEFWDMIKPVGDTLGNNVMPIYIIGNEYSAPAPEPYPKIHEGKAYRWKAGLYSDEEKTVWEVSHIAYRTEGGATPMPGLPEKRYSDAFLTVSDLVDWKIDSPEACEIAAQNGAGEVTLMILQTVRLASIVDKRNVYFDPKIIPDSTKIFWSIEAGDFHYIDACTGEYLGSYTLEQILSMKQS